MSKKVGLIGVGAIAEFHVRALRAAGFEVSGVASRAGSNRVHDFASRLDIAQVYENWQTLLQGSGQLDALLIATYPDGTPEVMNEAMRLDIPILVEKPVAWSSSVLAELASKAHERVFVGYNRRFYRPVQRARDEVQSGPPLLARLSMPEGVDPDVKDSNKFYLEPFFENSCHGLDMIRFVFGDLNIDSVKRLKRSDGRLTGLTAILSTERGDVVQIEGNWGSPSNFALSLHRRGRRFEVCPFEQATVYEGMEVTEPTEASPIRRYVPRVIERIDLDAIDLIEKPGFVAQAQLLSDSVDGKPTPPEVATLNDACAAIGLCEQLLGMPYPVLAES